MNKFQKAFTEAVKARGLRSVAPLKLGRGNDRQMFKNEKGTRMDLNAAVLSVVRRG